MVKRPRRFVVEQRRLFWNVAVRLPSLDTTLPRRFYDYDLAERWTDCVIRILLENVSARNAPSTSGDGRS